MFELQERQLVYVRQKRELIELVGFESRNKYEVCDEREQPIGFVAEQGKSLISHLLRNFIGHWRSFELQVFNAHRQPIGRASHPFRWFFQRLDVFDQQGRRLGALQQRFALFSKKFDLEDEHGRVVLTVLSPLWRFWTFIFKDSRGQESARIEKKWSGLLKEAFTDTDNFAVKFGSSKLPNATRNVLVIATVLIDLQYFEKKA